jgi:hypothetical protein
MVRLTLPLESQGNDFFFKVRSLTLKDLRETLPQHVSRVKIAGYQPIEFGSYPHEKQDRSSKLFGVDFGVRYLCFGVHWYRVGECTLWVGG